MRDRGELRAYQGGAIDFIKEKKRCALFVDPGLGKTVITATAFCDLIDDLVIGGMTLIVGPPRVARKTWPDEFKEWSHLRGHSFVHIEGSIAKRRKLLARRACFHIMSIDLLPWLLMELGGHCPDTRKIKKLLVEGKDDEAKKLHKWLPPTRMPYSAIVFDESSKVKNKKTNRWRALSLMAFRVEYFVALTGTPAANGLHDLWAQIYLIDRGERLGSTLTAFRERWFKENWNGNGYRVKGDYVQNAIEERIADVVFTLREEDYANLPPRMYNSIILEFDHVTAQKYREFEKTYILQAVEKQIVVRDGAAITNKLMQLANGVVYDENKVEHPFHQVKLEALEDLFDELNGQRLFVAYQFKSDVRRILAKFKNARVLDEKQETQDAWNRGEIEILLVHPKSAAHGLNLQHGGNNVVWYGPTFSAEDYIQLNKRLHRSGQKKPVMVHHFVVKGTIDEDALASTNGKISTQESLLNALKKRIKNYTGKEYA